MSGEDLYYLMHKDDIVTIVEIDQISGSITKVASKVKKELLPLGANLSKDDLRSWWKRRAVPIQQGTIEMILKNQGISNAQSFLTRSYGLSLMDHYWIKPLDSPFCWKQVNLFTNDFRDDIGELQFIQDDTIADRIDLLGKTIFYPSASTQGELQKKWIIQDGKRCLIKGNYGDTFQQSINEVLATLLHQKQNKVPFVRYQLCDITVNHGYALGCICENFASFAVEFIPAYDVSCSEKKDNTLSEYEHFIRVCMKNGLSEESVRTFLEYQILSDFVLTNTDRHFNNFGILRDPVSLRFIGMAPIFDSGNSMFWNCTSLPQQDPLLNISVNSFRKKETDLLKYVREYSLINIDKLPFEDEVRALLEKGNLSQKQIDGIINGYLRKTELLSKLQHGDKIWDYKYDG